MAPMCFSHSAESRLCVADDHTVTLYHLQKQVTVHCRSWERKQRIELPSHREQVKKIQNKLA